MSKIDVDPPKSITLPDHIRANAAHLAETLTEWLSTLPEYGLARLPNVDELEGGATIPRRILALSALRDEITLYMGEGGEDA